MRADEMKKMYLAVCRTLIDKEKMLCELDSYIGDGDHGTTVARGFREAGRKLVANDYSYPADVAEDIGHTLEISMGGAIGPLLGSFFRAGTVKIGLVQDWGLPEFCVQFSEGLKRIQMLGDASEGDRTLVDALAPASRALLKAREEGKTLVQAFGDAEAAAYEGARETRNMQAKKGRAKFLREKSLGYVDAGATTIALIISSMCSCMNPERGNKDEKIT